MVDLTKQYGQFIAQPQWSARSTKELDIVKSGFIDTIATMIAGRNEPVVKILLAQHERAASKGLSSILLGEQKASAVDAARINATAGHALDFDDVALGGHPSTVLVPTALALGEEVGASGQQVLDAYLVGYEIWADLFVREKDPYHLKGWHPTAVLGTIGAAACAAFLRKLEPVQAQTALAIAASLASGLVANFGTMTKPFHAGEAAANGIRAVDLALAGMTASNDALEHHAGFLAALSPLGRVDISDSSHIGHGRLRIGENGLSIKKYPACYAVHRVADGVLDLVNKEDLQPSDIVHVEAEIGEAQASMLRNHEPKTGLEAKFSLEFAVASAVVRRKLGLSELVDDFVNTKEVQSVMKRIAITKRQGSCPIEPVFSEHDRVKITLSNGRVLDSGDIRFARGNALLPLSKADLDAKFRDCTEGVDGRDQLLHLLTSMEQQNSLNDLKVY